MDSHTTPGLWSRDFEAGLAVCAQGTLRFERRGDAGVTIAFVGAAPLSLESQCPLAGHAVAAIERAYRLRRRWAPPDKSSRPFLRVLLPRVADRASHPQISQRSLEQTALGRPR